MEKNKVRCKVCLVEKERILAGKYNFKDKKWVDDQGRAFNGKTCPTCYQRQVAERMRMLREKRKREKESATPSS